MKKVIVRRECTVDPNILSNLSPLLQRIYAARDISSSDEINRELQGLLPFESLKNIDIASERLAKALAKQENILIVGDFDADGATSTALVESALKQFGAEHVSHLVPNRFAYGYGLTSQIVDVAAEQHPELIITVDNGITSHEGIKRANELGIDVIVTDHHLAGDTLPDAVAIVNPNLPDCTFPSKCIAGVGVAFYVMLALRSYLKETGWFDRQQLEIPNMAQYLDLVALGTVSDVVLLDKNNRIMVYQGLRRIRAGYARPGVLALLEVSGRQRDNIIASDLGFAIGPRLNAAGRLDDMAIGIACLLAVDPNEAYTMAKQLDGLNRERRSIETQMKNQAFEILDKLDLEKEYPLGICLYDESWHQGVIGLVAARVKERLNRPVIAFAKGDDGMLKGSARSIKGLHIRDVLDAIAKSHPDVLTKFGGHSMAAGLSLEEKHYKIFSEEFTKEITKRIGDAQLQDCIESDGELEDQLLTLDTAREIRNAGPWGHGFPEPVFDGTFNLIDQHIVGRCHLKVILQVPGTDRFIDGIAFNINMDKWPNERAKSAVIAYKLDLNDYRGRQKLQLMIEDITAVT